MTVRSFVDTNVAVYLFDADEPAKQQVAREVFESSDLQLVVSTQVLGEFFVTVTRKLRRPMDAATAAEAVAELARLPVVIVDVPLVGAAIETSGRSQVSYRDALIVEAAAAAGCAQLLTEDLAAGATIHGVRIENPFPG
jgi:predicted nucleic acid-binding protein